MLRMLDQVGKPLELRVLPLCADDPIRCHPLVPGSLRTEKIPSGFVGAKLLFLFARELSALPLFVRVDAGFFCTTSAESLEAGGMPKNLFVGFSDEVKVDLLPLLG